MAFFGGTLAPEQVFFVVGPLGLRVLVTERRTGRRIFAHRTYCTFLGARFAGQLGNELRRSYNYYGMFIVGYSIL